MATYKIPLQNQPQQFPITLSGTDYVFIVKWNDFSQTWILDILDENQNPLICNIAMVAGADLLEGMDYIGIPGQLIIFTDNNQFADPTYENLGDTSNLYYYTTDTGST